MIGKWNWNYSLCLFVFFRVIVFSLNMICDNNFYKNDNKMLIKIKMYYIWDKNIFKIVYIFIWSVKKKKILIKNFF